jgi:cytochrome b involved in lipid metabolism
MKKIILFILFVLVLVIGCTNNENEKNDLKKTGPTEMPTPPATPYPQKDISEMISVDELSKHSTANDCWIAYNGNVYDITGFLPKHKGDISSLCGTSDKFQNMFENKHGTLKIEKLEQEGILKGKLG